MVDFPRPLATPVDRRYLRGKHESHLAGAAARGASPQPRFGVPAEPEQPWLGGDQVLPQFLGPPRMRKVARADDRDPLAKRPPGEMLEVAVPAAGTGEPGVDVQVGVEHAVAVRSPVRSSFTAGLPGRSDPATRVRHRGATAASTRMIRSESSATRAGPAASRAERSARMLIGRLRAEPAVVRPCGPPRHGRDGRGPEWRRVPWGSRRAWVVRPREPGRARSPAGRA